MASRVCLVHYHEIGLKGKNRKTFEDQLVANLRLALRSLQVSSVRRISGHIMVTFSSPEAPFEAVGLIRQVPGVARVSLAFRCLQDPDDYLPAAVEALGEVGGCGSFKVQAKRSNTDYPLHTIELNRQIGSALCEAFPDRSVDVHDPDVEVRALFNEGSAFIYAASERGVGGLPVGTAGKCVSLFSSGFDSPVATWMMGRRGATMVPVHFSGRPMTSDGSEWLCQDLVRALGPEGAVGRLYVVPFGQCQRDIALVVPQSLRILMYRRLMYAVAERIALVEGAKALVTGESLGQVASQTLDNIRATSEVVTAMPVLRPLIGSDKQEIIECAKAIGTYDISSQTAPDCCTLFMPRRPETHAKPAQVAEAWGLFDHDAMVEGLLRTVEYVDFDTCGAYRPPARWRERHDALAPAPLPDEG